MKKYKLEYEYGPDAKGVTEKGILIITCVSVDKAMKYFFDWFGITEDDETQLLLLVSEYTLSQAVYANGLLETQSFN